MDVARRDHTKTERMAWVSYKVFATRYMAIIHQLPQDFPALVVLEQYNTRDMLEPSGSRPPTRNQSSMAVYTDLSILRSSLEASSGLPATRDEPLRTFSNPGCGPQ